MADISLRDRRALVTGSAGVIGRELLTRLQLRGAKILSVDREPLPEGESEGIDHRRLDLADASLDALARFEPEVIFHLAAAFERSEETPGFWEPNWHDNVIVSHRIAELASRASALRTVVFASSYLLYRPEIYLFSEPREEAVWLREDDDLGPRNLCGAAKLYGERELEFVREMSQPRLRIVHARIFRSYGRGSRDVISRWVRASLANETIEVFNERNRFAYVFAGDVAEGLARLAECPEASGPVNLAFGRARSVRDVLDAIRSEVPGSRSEVRVAPARPPFEASGAEISRLRAWTGWEPATDLDDGIAKVVAYENARGATRRD